MVAADLMTPQPITLQPKDDVATALALFQEYDVRHLPVVNDAGELVGMVSDRDLRALVLPHFQRQDAVEKALTRVRGTVATIMSSNVLAVDMQEDVSVVAELIIEHKVGAIPVVDGDGSLVGIVSYVDLLRHYLRGED